MANSLGCSPAAPARAGSTCFQALDVEDLVKHFAGFKFLWQLKLPTLATKAASPHYYMPHEERQLSAIHDVEGRTGSLPDIPKREGLLARHLQRWKASLARVCWFLLLKLASSAVATCNSIASIAWALVPLQPKPRLV